MIKISHVAITTENLFLWYGEKEILKDINLQIAQNKVTALIGPSGCGKSAFLRTLNRMYELTPSARVSGKVLYNGENILSPKVDANALRREIGTVFQKPAPFPMSIFDNIAYAPRAFGIFKKAQLAETVETSLKDAALWEEVKDKLKSSALFLSGGQQQRLCIARALAAKPKVLLMDEPTAALDPVSTAKIEELILRLKKDYTIVLVTHNMRQAKEISDYSAFFMPGELVEYAPTQYLFYAPKDRRTREYLKE